MSSETSRLRELIDAAVENPDRAKDLIRERPELKDARYIHGETALHFLAIEGYVKGVRVLLELGLDPNACNEFGEPPLLDVIRLGNCEIVRLLLAGGADARWHSETYGSLLECAAIGRDARMVELLREYGA